MSQKTAKRLRRIERNQQATTRRIEALEHTVVKIRRNRSKSLWDWIRRR